SINYTGPIDLVTIAELSEKDSWFEDQSFTLEGYIIKQVNDKTFLFTDGADEITVNIRADNVESFSDKDKVRITGEYENEFFSKPHFDVKRITLLSI
ncbi:YgiW/YdeI family stress tolerance OB fold protein, partial [Photobacterium proteolyticum]